MDISSSHTIQLIVALSIGLVLFLVTYFASLRKIIAVFAVVIPFQFIASRYGSINMVAVYMIFFALLLRSVIKSTPFLTAIFFIFISYLLSLFSAPKELWADHFFYIVTVASDFLLFYITYNIVIRYPDVKFFLRILIVMDFLCVAYSILLYIVGFDKLALFGVDEWMLTQNLEEKKRLMGAFQAAGVNAAFYASQVLILIYAAFFTEKGWVKYFCYFLAIVNFGLIVASGSRGSFLTLIGSCFLLLYFFRSALGYIRTMKIVVIGISCFFAISIYVVTQTNFNVMFERLASTEVNESGVPDTRQIGFKLTLERIGEAIVVGHGPEIDVYEQFRRHIPGYRPLGFYPHNLALFLIYSIGFIGLVSYLFFFGALFFKLFKARKNKHKDRAIQYIPTLGIIFMIMFFVDQLKIEFLRFSLSDYQHYIFFLLAMFVAFAKVATSGKKST